ncbi:MAG: iron-sulfur cluster assembly accessory protein [Buchnera aphidicola (Pentalonia nigronervosa)]|jgi:Fe-S cluster assembly protein SufA|uniref:Iron-sulfur cluster assembly accessory protein n=1 Tax=Buchnera aphidicola (Pentalonia nigronervosa) TaxID=1309793 RepID=A0A7H1AZF0_9GAMM|nr:MAG: iron-sulfur cluster assembly accessory protein [Buchnera aphidicola (Pentalonia nigronervosa)]
MKNNKMNNSISNKNQYININITKSAVKQILFLINLNSENKGIKLGIKKSGCAGFRYTMKLVQDTEIKNKTNDNYVLFSYEDILIIIKKKDRLCLDGIKIDFIKDNINEIFKFHNSKFQKFCGCGSSFSTDPE